MTIENHREAAPDNNAETDTPKASEFDYKSAFEQLQAQNQQIQQNLEILTKSKASPEPVKKPALTEEQFQELLQKNPKAAIEMSVSGLVDDRARDIETRLTRENQKNYWDEKAKNDFPLDKDSEFQKAVRQHVQELVSAGDMSRESPRLIYTAAKLAAADRKLKDKSDSKSTSSISGEAPSNVQRSTSKSSKKPESFEVMAKMFGRDEKAQARILERIQERQARRRGEG